MSNEIKELLCKKCDKLFKTKKLTEICPSCKKAKKKNKWGEETLWCPKCLSPDLEEKQILMAGANRDIKVVVTAKCKACGKASRVGNLYDQARMDVINGE